MNWGIGPLIGFALSLGCGAGIHDIVGFGLKMIE
jgi:hypothetical protein